MQADNYCQSPNFVKKNNFVRAETKHSKRPANISSIALQYLNLCHSVKRLLFPMSDSVGRFLALNPRPFACSLPRMAS